MKKAVKLFHGFFLYYYIIYEVGYQINIPPESSTKNILIKGLGNFLLFRILVSNLDLFFPLNFLLILLHISSLGCSPNNSALFLKLGIDVDHIKLGAQVL